MLNPDLLQHLSDGQYEFVNVTFQAADTDTIIPYTRLTPEDPTEVRWIEITPNAVNVGGTDTVPNLYQSALPTAQAWVRGYIVLRSSVAGYTTRLKLFLERT